MTRVIENVLCFQQTDANGQRHYVTHPFFTMVTPGCFALNQDPPRPLSRLYQYMFQNYQNDRQVRLLAEVNACTLAPRQQARWHYPPNDVLQERVNALVLQWVTYDMLFAQLPDSPLREAMRVFWRQHGGYQGRPAF
jgi:hypothetical protein